jgi:hypothetical protein
MPIRWEKSELARSRERGAWDRWGVQDAELRADWIWFAFNHRRVYAPLEHREMPGQFARDDSPGALMAFVGQYGRLGWNEFQEVQDHPRFGRQDTWLSRMKAAHRAMVDADPMVSLDAVGAVNAEPLEWLQAHARTVRWCLEAANALRTPNARARDRDCADLARRFPSPFGRRGSIGVSTSLMRYRTATMPTRQVGGLLEDLLWINLEGVRRRVLYEGDGRFRSVWGGDTLIESLYTLVADAVTGGRLKQCEAPDCGTVFLQTDERQRFCPPREGQEKSTCMNRLRMQRQRRAKRTATSRRTVTHGKTTRKR